MKKQQPQQQQHVEDWRLPIQRSGFDGIEYLLVTGFPVKLRNSSLGQALPRLEISSKDPI